MTKCLQNLLRDCTFAVISIAKKFILGASLDNAENLKRHFCIVHPISIQLEFNGDDEKQHEKGYDRQHITGHFVQIDPHSFL